MKNIAGFRVLAAHLVGARQVYVVQDENPLGFRLSEEAPKALPLDEVLALLSRVVQWSLQEKDCGDFPSTVPYFKYHLVAVDKVGKVVFGWLAFAVATPDGAPDAAGVPIKEYSKAYLPEAENWYTPFFKSRGHLLGSFEESDRQERKAMMKKLEERERKRRREG